ncbi:hypothetical protein KC19_3G208700 [Ceratodon purpureus]|uniref:Uncharacterized protein n=1 Tax=Ceratodon purpureus TaxID=3225 RepID=A0A8T0IN55_CERPU|nr:hypothetical protein KC19_3G208700 [Ceratodon purpureus]
MADGEAAATACVDAVLKSAPVPKQNEPPKILPTLNVPQDDALVKKGCEQELQGDIHSEFYVEAKKNINPEMILRHLQITLAGIQHQPPRKDFSNQYIQKEKVFIAMLEEFSLEAILFKEKDLVFLQQFLDHVLDVHDGEKIIISPVKNSPPTGDPVLEALASAPSCYYRTSAVLLAPILDDI